MRLGDEERRKEGGKRKEIGRKEEGKREERERKEKEKGKREKMRGLNFADRCDVM